MTTTRRSPRRTRPRPSAPKYPETLRTSERGALNRCRQRWAWSYNERLHLKRETPALRFGTLIHRALEHYYSDKNQARRRPIHPARTFVRLFDEELEETQKVWMKWRDEDDEWHTYRELGEAMLVGYVEHWREARQHNDNEYLVLSVEQRFTTKIMKPRGGFPLIYPSPTMYVGTLDRILYHLPTRRLLFGDYKTTKNDPTKNPHLALDEQAGAYWALAPDWLTHEAPEALRKAIMAKVAHLPRQHRKAVEAWRFDGILYDFLKKTLPESRPTDEQGYALNKPKKDALLAHAKKEGIRTAGLKVDELIDAIDAKHGEGWAGAHLGDRSERQQGPLFHREVAFRDPEDRSRVLRRIYEDAREIGLMRLGKLAIKKSPDRFICIGCQFIDMCELHETGAHWEEFRDGMYEDWDPYATYEIDRDELE